MTQNENDGTTRAQLAMRSIHIFDFDKGLGFLQRHGGKLQPAKNVDSEPLKVAAHQTASLGYGFLLAERNRDITKSEFAIFWRQGPRENATDVSDKSQKRQRERR